MYTGEASSMRSRPRRGRDPDELSLFSPRSAVRRGVDFRVSVNAGAERTLSLLSAFRRKAGRGFPGVGQRRHPTSSLSSLRVPPQGGAWIFSALMLRGSGVFSNDRARWMARTRQNANRPPHRGTACHGRACLRRLTRTTASSIRRRSRTNHPTNRHRRSRHRPNNRRERQGRAAQRRPDPKLEFVNASRSPS